MARPLKYWSKSALLWLNLAIILGSVLFCVLLQLSSWPFLTLLDARPSWLLIWVVAWSAKRSPWLAVGAGIAVGWVQDALSFGSPSHAWGLALVAFLTSRLDKQRFIEEEVISAAIIVMVMAMINETCLGAQLVLQGLWSWPVAWSHWQTVVLSSALISSLWTPIIYVPLNYWWDTLQYLIEHPRRFALRRRPTR